MGATAVPMTTERGPDRFSHWLSLTAKEARRDAGLSAELVALASGRGIATIRRFESAQHQPQDLEHVLAVYAALTGAGDARTLYARAMRRWLDEGESPEPAADIEEFLKLAARRRAQDELT